MLDHANELDLPLSLHIPEAGASIVPAIIEGAAMIGAIVAFSRIDLLNREPNQIAI